jgi:hypothetical protein
MIQSSNSPPSSSRRRRGVGSRHGAAVNAPQSEFASDQDFAQVLDVELLDMDMGRR